MLYCKYCGEEFKSPKELKKHEKKCAKEEEDVYEDFCEKYTCRNCHKTFYSKQDLKHHVLNCTVTHRVDQNSVE